MAKRTQHKGRKAKAKKRVTRRRVTGKRVKLTPGGMMKLYRLMAKAKKKGKRSVYVIKT